MKYYLHTGLKLFITKYKVVKKFRKMNLIKQFAHSLENWRIVIPLQDWDVDHGTVEQHRQRFSKVNREVIVTMVVNFLFNFVMLVPLIYTGWRLQRMRGDPQQRQSWIFPLSRLVRSLLHFF